MEQEIVQAQNNYPQSLSNFEKSMLGFLEQRNLPTEGIFSKLDERIVIFQNLDHVIAGTGKRIIQMGIQNLKKCREVLFISIINWDGKY